MEDLEWHDQILVDIKSQVERFGNAVTYVGGQCAKPGCAGDHPSDLDSFGLPPYGYTVGLPQKFDHPELLVIGSRELTTWLLNVVAGAVAQGVRLEHGYEIEITQGHGLKLARTAQSFVRDGLIAVSFDYHEMIGHRRMEAPLQVMWPDAQGRWPDDPACDPELKREQPWLGRRQPLDHLRRHRARRR
jgi:hypothetical protein